MFGTIIMVIRLKTYTQISGKHQITDLQIFLELVSILAQHQANLIAV